jgi:hypothetical protein
MLMNNLFCVTESRLFTNAGVETGGKSKNISIIFLLAQLLHVTRDVGSILLCYLCDNLTVYLYIEMEV